MSNSSLSSITKDNKTLLPVVNNLSDISARSIKEDSFHGHAKMQVWMCEDIRKREGMGECNANQNSQVNSME